MAGVLEIQTDTQESQAAQPASEVGMQDLPEYLQVEGDESRTPVAISIVAVLFFLLTTVGIAAGTQYYLIPQRTDAEANLQTQDTELESVNKKIITEEKKGEEHLKKLKSLQEQLTSPLRPERTQVADDIAEVKRIAREVALRNVDGGSYVTIQSLSIAETGAVSVSGSVDSFLTLADWFEALEASESFRGLKLSNAGVSGEGAKASVPYSFSFTREPAKPKPAAAVTPTTDTADAPTPPTDGGSDAPSAAPSSIPASDAPSPSTPPSIPSTVSLPTSAPTASAIPSELPSDAPASDVPSDVPSETPSEPTVSQTPPPTVQPAP